MFGWILLALIFVATPLLISLWVVWAICFTPYRKDMDDLHDSLEYRSLKEDWEEWP